MTKGDILGNSLTGAHFSCNSHGNIPFPAGKECPSLRPPPRAELTPAITQRCSQPSPRDWASARRYYKPCAKVHVERRSLPQPLVLFQPTANGAFCPPKLRLTRGVSPSRACSLRWDIFHSHPSALRLAHSWCCWGASGSGGKGQEGALSYFQQWQPLFPHPGSHQLETALWGKQGVGATRKAKFSSMY